MRINRNVNSIAAASLCFAKHQYPFTTIYDFNKAIVSMNVEKNIFSITYISSENYDGDDGDYDRLFYQDPDTTYYELNKADLNSIIRFHVGLILPKEKSQVIRKIAQDVIKSMKIEHAYTQFCHYGHSVNYSKYVISIDEFISIVTKSVIPVIE